MSALVILTRPAGRNDGLAHALREAGRSVYVWPALRIDPVEVAPSAVPSPDDFDLAVFVSGNAARLYLRQAFPAGGQWPASCAAATVGPASAQALRDSGFFGAETTLIHPGSQAATHDSEALWQCLMARPLPRRVLILRGTQGRNWLADRLRAHGVEVFIHAVYARQPQAWSAQQVAQVRHWAATQQHPNWLITSGESIDAIAAQAAGAGVLGWMRQCRYLITHPVLRQRLDGALGGDAPVAMVKECLPVDEAIFEALVAG
ncbi:uroporphyrinogen-III synthase [Bordetella trematum]|uniref:uroporphyrinogen-III synthase n=1 Tax=Bordetella trematum TaxID=123899 RepID=UPI003D147B82